MKSLLGRFLSSFLLPCCLVRDVVVSQHIFLFFFKEKGNNSAGLTSDISVGGQRPWAINALSTNPDQGIRPTGNENRNRSTTFRFHFLFPVVLITVVWLSHIVHRCDGEKRGKNIGSARISFSFSFFPIHSLVDRSPRIINGAVGRIWK